MRAIAFVLGLAATLGVGLVTGGGAAWFAAVGRERAVSRSALELARVDADRRREAAMAELREAQRETQRQFEERLSTIDAKRLELAAQMDALRAAAAATDAKKVGTSSKPRTGLQELTDLVREVGELGTAVKDVTQTVRQIGGKP